MVEQEQVNAYQERVRVGKVTIVPPILRALRPSEQTGTLTDFTINDNGADVFLHEATSGMTPTKIRPGLSLSRQAAEDAARVEMLGEFALKAFQVNLNYKLNRVGDYDLASGEDLGNEDLEISD